MATTYYVKHLVANKLDLKWGISVNSVGSQDIGADMPYPPDYPSTDKTSEYVFSTEQGRILNEYQILYITKGKGLFTSDSTGRKIIPINEGNMFLLFPREWHNYMPDKKTGWKEYWIGFKGENIDSRISNGFFSKSRPVFNVGLHDEIVNLYQRALQVATDQVSGFQVVLSSITNYLLSLAFFYDRNNTFSTSDIEKQINRAKTLISDQYKTIKPQQLADDLCMSYSNFRKIFKMYTGFAPAQYINEIKLTKIKELLSYSQEPIKDIVFASGFNNYEYFFCTFKKKEGITPQQYRLITQYHKTGQK
ncbi:MAG: AraC family transcriptional regulator [Bacteroidales bacterium]|jgi:AraC-like DNA-binding protein|nr:AraC family transcriptional regulator [Bacteroidales bacterium]